MKGLAQGGGDVLGGNTQPFLSKAGPVFQAPGSELSDGLQVSGRRQLKCLHLLHSMSEMRPSIYSGTAQPCSGETDQAPKYDVSINQHLKTCRHEAPFSG